MTFPKIQELKKYHFQDLEKKLHRPVYDITKRFFDVIVSFSGLFLLLPFWFLLVVIIRIDSPGEAIFCHERVGKNGKIFKLYKFRTMYHGVKDQELAPQSPHDARITRIGKFLRRTSLDEMPQLLNVLKGDMSLVGPRPEMGFIVKHYTPLERRRLLVKPGLTGLWQILGRKDLPLHHNLEYDFYYIEHRSLFFDLIIIIKTFAVVISGKGAY
jgi:lipopolysaccharide/colanic/teichoic acid biosynthesis glycosyltransferase